MPSPAPSNHNPLRSESALADAGTDRFKSIDILRTVAVLLVMGRHMPLCPAETSAVAHSISSVWIRGGWIGVDLFFVLSGFLVSGLLFREFSLFKKISLKRFLLRRGFKIYPAFWLLILVTMLATLVQKGGVQSWETLSELLFIQNYGPALWGHTWSLAVEEHFYILLVCLIAVFTRSGGGNPFARLPMVIAVVCVVCFSMRVMTAMTIPFSSRTHIFPSHLRIDSLFFGVLISHWYSSNSARFLELGHRYKTQAMVIGLMCLLPAFLYPISVPFITSLGLTLFYLGAGLILFALISVKKPQGKVSGVMAFLGQRSYSIYLWHYPVLKWFAPRVGNCLGYDNWFLFIAAYFLGSLALGCVMASLVEAPVLRLRDRWFPSLSSKKA